MHFAKGIVHWAFWAPMIVITCYLDVDYARIMFSRNLIPLARIKRKDNCTTCGRAYTKAIEAKWLCWHLPLRSPRLEERPPFDL